jgi:hypothetical protein
LQASAEIAALSVTAVSFHRVVVLYLLVEVIAFLSIQLYRRLLKAASDYPSKNKQQMQVLNQDFCRCFN